MKMFSIKYKINNVERPDIMILLRDSYIRPYPVCKLSCVLPLQTVGRFFYFSNLFKNFDKWNF
nr:MAG TPA: hypothetical protein [Bacteriophage sp.]